MGGLVVRWMEGWMDGWTEGWTDGWLHAVCRYKSFRVRYGIILEESVR